MNGKRIAALILALLMTLSLMSCGSSAASGESASVQSVAMLMGVSLSGSNQYSGIVEARSTVKVNKDSNKTLGECYVEAGDEVRVGDKLFSYDTDALSLSVETAQLEVEQMYNSIASYESQIAQMEKDKKKAPASEQLSYTLQIQETVLNKAEDEYNVKQKEAELERLRKSMDEVDVFSEVSGIVQNVNNSDNGGDSYGGDSDGSFITIMETGTYKIKAKASEEVLRNLYEGMEMTVYSRVDADASWHGYIDSINTSSTEQENNEGSGESSSKYSFYVELDTSDGLLIGQHVYLKAGGGEENEGIWISSGYLLPDGASVWAANSKDKLEKRSVTLGAYDEETDRYEIVSGLALEDYIAYPEDSFTEGMSVVRYDESSFDVGGDAGVDEAVDAVVDDLADAAEGPEAEG